MPLVGRGRVDGGLVVVGRARFFVRGFVVSVVRGLVVVGGKAAFLVRTVPTVGLSVVTLRGFVVVGRAAFLVR